jgi:hypothetical protein
LPEAGSACVSHSSSCAVGTAGVGAVAGFGLGWRAGLRRGLLPDPDLRDQHVEITKAANLKTTSKLE